MDTQHSAVNEAGEGQVVEHFRAYMGGSGDESKGITAGSRMNGHEENRKPRKERWTERTVQYFQALALPYFRKHSS